MKTVALTGATGFVCSHVAEGLLAEGWRVRLPTRRRAPLLDEFAEKGAEIVEGDLREASFWPTALAGADLVIHGAAATKARCYADYLEANEGLTRRVLDGTPSGSHLIHLSSMAVSGPAGLGTPATEATGPAPLTDYGRTKLSAEEAVITWQEAGGAATVLRPGIIYGPREADLRQLFQIGAKGFYVYPAPAATCSLLYIDDLVAAVLAIARDPRAGETYLVANDEEAWDWREIGDVLAEALGRRMLRVPMPRAGMWAYGLVAEWVGRLTGSIPALSRQKVREAFSPWVADCTHLRKDYGWAPAVGARDGFARTAAWYRQEGWL